MTPPLLSFFRNQTLLPHPRYISGFFGQQRHFTGTWDISSDIRVAVTPNPNALKIILPTSILRPGQASLSFFRHQFDSTCGGTSNYRECSKPKEDGLVPNLIARLFLIGPIHNVLIATNFITVTKSADDPRAWKMLAPRIKGVVRDEIAIWERRKDKNPGAVFDAEDESSKDYFYGDADDEMTADRIFDIVEDKIRPILQEDGGDCTFLGYDDGSVHLRLLGACPGCPYMNDTLMNGILKILSFYVSDIEEIILVRSGLENED